MNCLTHPQPTGAKWDSAGFPPGETRATMIDNFALALTHLLMLIAAWRLVKRADLDEESARDPGMRRHPSIQAEPGPDA